MICTKMIPFDWYFERQLPYFSTIRTSLWKTYTGLGKAHSLTHFAPNYIKNTEAVHKESTCSTIALLKKFQTLLTQFVLKIR